MLFSVGFFFFHIQQRYSRIERWIYVILFCFIRYDSVKVFSEKICDNCKGKLKNADKLQKS